MPVRLLLWLENRCNDCLINNRPDQNRNDKENGINGTAKPERNFENMPRQKHKKQIPENYRPNDCHKNTCRRSGNFE